MRAIEILSDAFEELSPEAFRLAMEMAASADENGEVWRAPVTYRSVPKPDEVIKDLIAARVVVEVDDDARRFVYRIPAYERAFDAMVRDGARIKHRNYQRSRATAKGA